MRIAVSNIAWTAAEDPEMLDVLCDLGVDALELAPTRVWPEPAGVSVREARDVARRLTDRGLPVVALQSLLFGVPGADLFGPEEATTRTSARLDSTIALAGAMAAPVLVLGSPSARRPPATMSAEQAMDTAVSFLRPLAARAAAEGVVLCVEPNPPQYGCAFVTTAAEGRVLVDAVDSPGFGLHLDAAAMAMASDDGPAAVRAHAAVLRHFHASAPNLGPLEDEVVHHRALARALAASGYDGYVSIEMRAAERDNAARVRAAVGLVASAYGSEHEEAA